MFGVDPAFGRANHMNWRQLLGTDPDQAIDDFRRRLQRVDPAAQVLETEYRFRHTDGSWHWALDRAYVVDRAPDGSTRRVLGLVVDITDRKIRETGALGRRPALPRGGARIALRDLRHRRGDRPVDRRRRRTGARLHAGGAAARRRLGGAGASR